MIQKIIDDYKTIFFLFVVWQILILIFLYFGFKTLSLQSGYLGGGAEKFQLNPFFWWHSNFDGEHYIEIARWGYRPLQYFFFPLYPYTIGVLATYFQKMIDPFVFSGVLISNVSLFFVSIFLFKLTRLDFSKRISILTLVLLFLFPTSFFFAAVYSESIFLLLVVISFYFARKGNFLVSGILGALASATRIIGIILFLSIFVEWFVSRRNKNVFSVKFLSVFLIPVGLIVYMIFLKNNANDPFAFFHNISIYGGQRSENLVFLPQVFYRYFFKILPNSFTYLPTFIITILELVSGVLFLILIFYSYIKLRFSYFLFLFLGYLIPTLSGSFSSMPRYVLVLFPGFISMAFILDKVSPIIRYLVIGAFGILLFLFTTMFATGYWVS